MSQANPINHPGHYNQLAIECIEVVRHLSFNMGNAIKYVWRYKDKNGVEDLKKALWYVRDEQAESYHPIVAKLDTAFICKVLSNFTGFQHDFIDAVIEASITPISDWEIRDDRLKEAMHLLIVEIERCERGQVS